jgi:clan AA aspartic protease
MITGELNADLEIILRLQVQDVQGTAHEVETVIDTGYNGFVTLPPALVASLGLRWLYREQGRLADGSVRFFDVYEATVLWDGQPRTVEVDQTDGHVLLGRAMMSRSELRAPFVSGGVATITAIP